MDYNRIEKQFNPHHVGVGLCPHPQYKRIGKPVTGLAHRPAPTCPHPQHVPTRRITQTLKGQWIMDYSLSISSGVKPVFRLIISVEIPDCFNPLATWLMPFCMPFCRPSCLPSCLPFCIPACIPSCRACSMYGMTRFVTSATAPISSTSSFSNKLILILYPSINLSRSTSEIFIPGISFALTIRSVLRQNADNSTPSGPSRDIFSMLIMCVS